MTAFLAKSARTAWLWAAAAAIGACGAGSPAAPQPVGLSLSCPANIERDLVGAEAVIVFAPPVPSGGRAPVSVTCDPASGSPFRAGSTQVVCTASDGSGQRVTCAFGVNLRALPQLQVTRFLVFGDSLTEGKLSLTPAQLIESPPHSYPFKLEALLNARYPNQGVQVLNEGQGGERATEAARRFEAAIDSHRPEAVLLMQGLNDLNADGLAGIQRAADALEELVKEARRNGLPTLLATLPPVGPGPKAGCPECIEPFNARIRSMAAAKGALIVDVFGAWRPGLMGADGIHPNELGYDAIAEAFFNVIRQHLERPAGS